MNPFQKKILAEVMKKKREEKKEINEFWVKSGLHKDTMDKIHKKIEESKVDPSELPF